MDWNKLHQLFWEMDFQTLIALGGTGAFIRILIEAVWNEIRKH